MIKNFFELFEEVWDLLLAKENLCLYGYAGEIWEVSLPAEEVPSELPEPVLGINFARDGLITKEWTTLVATHSDSWVISVAFFFASRFGFNEDDRERLFNMINRDPTICEVVNGTANGQVKDKSAISNNNKSKSKSKGGKKKESQAKYSKASQDLDDSDGEDDDEQGETFCGLCSGKYRRDEFWIACDVCETWYHGWCVKITQAKAKHIKSYKCHSCNNKRARFE